MTTLPFNSVSQSFTVAAAASHGVATNTTSADAAVWLSPAAIDSSRSDHLASSLSATSMARYLDLDPITTSKPTDANRTARPLPAGPVPPRTPISMEEVC